MLDPLTNRLSEVLRSRVSAAMSGETETEASDHVTSSRGQQRETPEAEVALSADLVEDARAHLAFLREVVERSEMFDERKLRNGQYSPRTHSVLNKQLDNFISHHV